MQGFTRLNIAWLGCLTESKSLILHYDLGKAWLEGEDKPT